MGECLQRLGARLPNEKSDLITLPLPRLSELLFLIRVRCNYSSLRHGRWCDEGVGGGMSVTFAAQKKISAVSTTGHNWAPTTLMMQDCHQDAETY